MKITAITILFSIVSCIAIYRTIKNLKNEKVGYRSGLLWIAIWGGILIFGIFPDYLNIAMKLVKMNNRMIFILIIAVFILYAIVFNQASHIDNMNRNIRKLVREIAILNYQLLEKNKDESDK